MSLIDDVRSEVRGLDLSARSLRRFALAVGGVLALLACWVAFRRHAPAMGVALAGAAAILGAAGAAFPARLRPLYRAWMGVAFALGWFVSRAILTVLFFLVVTPTGLLGRLTGKRFLETAPEPGRDTYWVKRDRSRKDHYERMY